MGSRWTEACPAVPHTGHATYPPGEPKLRDRLIAPTAGRAAWRHLRGGAFVAAGPRTRRHERHDRRCLLVVDDGPFFSRRVTVCTLIDFRQAHSRARSAGVPRQGAARSGRSDGTEASARSRTCRAPTANWQPKALRCSTRDQLPGPLEVGGAVPQTALIPLAISRYSFRPPNFAVHSQKDKKRDRIHRSACLEPTGLKGLF